MAWAKPAKNGYYGMYRDSAGNKRAVKDSQGKNIVYRRPSDAKFHGGEAEQKARRRAPDARTVDAKLTFGGWTQLLKDEKARNGQAETNTPNTDKSIDKNYVMPRWETAALNQIQDMDVQAWVDGLAARRPKLQPSYVRRIYSVFSARINAAIKAKVLTGSPLIGIDLPAIPPKAMPFMTSEWLDSARPALRSDYQDALEFELESGLRPAELCGLHLNVVDPAINWFYVRGVLMDLKPIDGKPRIQFIRMWTKSGNERAVPLTARALEIIDKVTAGRDMRQGCGLEHSDGKPCRSDVIFRAVDGRPMRPELIQSAAMRAADKLGLERRTPYGARRGFGTWASNGVDAFALSEIMGHADVNTTRKHYTQVTTAVRGRLQIARGESVGLQAVPNLGHAGQDFGAAQGATSAPQAPTNSDATGDEKAV